MQTFLLALGFLTRLAPARIASSEEMRKACRFFPLAGLCLGVLCVAPFYWGILHGYPWLQAWLFVLLHVYLTRGFHHDGIADLADALGSGRQGDAFRNILKDSHLGAFGALGLCLTLSGQFITSYYLLQSQAFAVLVAAPLLSRSLALVYAVTAPMHKAAALGKISGDSDKQTSLIIGMCSAFAVLFFMPATALLVVLTGNALLYSFFYRLAQKNGGFNGDFLGSLVCLSEIATPLLYLATLN